MTARTVAETSNQLVSVAFADEAEYRRATDFAFEQQSAAGLELTDTAEQLSVRLRPWLLHDLRDRCRLHLLPRQPYPRGAQHHAAGCAPGAGALAQPATRIQLICPCGDAPRFRAANEVVTALLGAEQVRRWGGLTYSSIADPAFTGAYWDSAAGDWSFDRHVLVLIDAPGSEQEGHDYAAALHDLVATIYARHGRRQERLWVTAHSLTVVTPPALPPTTEVSHRAALPG